MLIKIKLLITSILVSFSISSFAYDLDGEWEVDIKRTLDFNASNIKMTSLRASLLECSIKHTKLFFSNGRAAFVVKDHLCEHKNKQAGIKGTFDDFSYSVLFENDKQSVLKLQNKTKDEHVEVVNWIDSSSFWLDDGDQGEINRHFYKKVSTLEK